MPGPCSRVWLCTCMADRLSRLLALLAVSAVLLMLLTSLPTPVECQDEYLCTPRYCAAFEANCKDAKCKSKLKTLPKMTKCACCDICVKVLRENEECHPGGTEFTPDTECGPHLSCQPLASTSSGKHVCMKMANMKEGCEYERSLVEQNPSKYVRRAAMPECSEEGDYLAKQCKNGTFCECVSQNGRVPIFGISLYHESKDMNCHCSRKFNQLNEKLKELSLKPLDPINFMRCKSNGNFEEFQYYGNYTYCMDVANGTIKDRHVNKHSARQLPCYNKMIKFETKCIQDYNNKIAKLNEIFDQAEGKIAVGYDLPNCDLDGTYAPVQCFNEQCFCVDKEGFRMGSRATSSAPSTSTVSAKGFSVDRASPLSWNQTCVCARQLELLRNLKSKYRNKITEMFARYKCDQNGNYLGLQCSDSICYCVDPLTGFEQQLDEDLKPLKSEHENVKKLPCYREYSDKNWLNEQYKLTCGWTDNINSIDCIRGSCADPYNICGLAEVML